MSDRTIAAIATPLGEASVGVIRISGDKALEVADRVFFAFSGEKLKNLPGYRAAYGRIRNGQTVLDEAVALVFRAPKSYTGEDVVELSVHGGRLMVRSVLQLVIENGASLALPGEFTKRAFLNGKMDLAKAESVMGLISAHSEAELKMSRAAHAGKLTGKIAAIEAELVTLAASFAVYADYPEEELEGLKPESFVKKLCEIESKISHMLSQYNAGRVLREGIDTVIVGKPNVGKSTLMNMLSGVERSIVTDVAGTTRDVIEDTVMVGDIPLRLADTAGIRTTDDTVEHLGVMRAKERLQNAELILAVFDGTKPLDDDDRVLLSEVSGRNTIVILNKSDLEVKIDRSVFEGMRVVETSAKLGEGYEKLAAEIAELTGAVHLDPDSAVLMGERQRDCAARALASVRAAAETLKSGYTLDAVGVCVDDTLSALMELTGKRVTNEVADEVFRRFCVGK